MTLRFYYATQVWQEALVVFSKELRSDFCFGTPIWEADGGNFRFIEFKQTNNASLDSKITRFGEILKEVADSKKIFVSEQVIRDNKMLDNDFEKFKEEVKITYVLDKDNLNGWGEFCPDLSDYNFYSDKKTYSWNEIKDLFVEISPRILSLVHYKNMNFYNPNDCATIALHKACKKLDIVAVKQALSDGANPNGFDTNGDTPLGVCVEDFFGFINRQVWINRPTK